MARSKKSKDDEAQEDLTIADRILEAAFDVFMAEGFSGATTDTIQSQSGLAKSTIYRYFPSKESLFIAAVGNGGARFLRSLEKLDLDYTDIRSFLNRFGIRYLEKLLAKRGLNTCRLLVAESHRFPHLGRIFYRNGPKRVIEFVEAHLVHAHRRGEIDVEDPPSAAAYFTAMITGDLQLRGMLGEKLPSKKALTAHVAKTVDLFLFAHRRQTGPRKARTV